MAALAEERPKRWTYEEYARLDDEQRYEIIEGELLRDRLEFDLAEVCS